MIVVAIAPAVKAPFTQNGIKDESNETVQYNMNH